MASIEGIFKGAGPYMFTSSPCQYGTMYVYDVFNEDKVAMSEETLFVPDVFNGIEHSRARKGDRIRITKDSESTRIRISSYWLRLPKHSYSSSQTND
ncbi:hypothetical protein GOV11_03665 [Candidatus Woesearchaeota archaeon]|nr:hypothetical protein [Candidatus Woesearchaeota archaeon]